ncbi:MAG: GatB/YqeY domain-containing protein [Pseudomonadales bacterium]
MSDLKTQIGETTKDAMRARDKSRVAALRMVNAELKRVEVDERKTLTDDDVLAILNRMLKQRNDSLSQFEQADREDLAAQERFEIELIKTFMPEPLSEAEVDAVIERAIEATGATSMKDMGQVMGLVKAEIATRADMGAVSSKVKARLA